MNVMCRVTGHLHL